MTASQNLQNATYVLVTREHLGLYYYIRLFRCALRMDNQSRKTGNTDIQCLQAEMLTSDIWWHLAVLHMSKKLMHLFLGAGEHDFIKFLSEYIPDIALITTENAKTCCTDRV